MAVNPAISLGVRPVQTPDPLEMYGRIQQLKALGLSQQLQNEQLTSAHMQNLLAQRQIAEDDASKQAVAGWQPGVNDSETFGRMLKASPKAALSFQKSITDQKKAATEQQKAEVDLRIKQLEEGKSKAERFGAIVGTVKDADTFTRAIGSALGEGLVSPQEAMQYLQMGWTPQTQAAVGQIAQMAQSVVQQHDQQIKDAEEQRKMALFPAQQASAQAKATADQWSTAAQTANFQDQASFDQWRASQPPEIQKQVGKIYTPDLAGWVQRRGMTAAQRATATQGAADLQERRRHNQAMEAHGRASEPEMSPAAMMPVPQGASEQQILSGYAPMVQSMAKQLRDYKIPLPTGRALQSAFWQQAVDLAGKLDPAWNAAEYPARLGVMRDFRSGKSAQALTSFNTVIGHLGSLKEAADKLDNSDFRGFNTVGNWISQQKGDPRVRDFNIARNAVADELMKAFRATGGTESEVQAWKAELNASDSPAQLSTAIRRAIDLLGSRVSALEDQYQRGMGKAKDFQFLSPKARQTLKKLGSNPDDFDPTYGGAQQPTAPQRPPLSSFER